MKMQAKFILGRKSILEQYNKLKELAEKRKLELAKNGR